MPPKDIIALLLGVIGCCLYGYIDHIVNGISNNILSVDHSVKDFFSYLSHWTLLLLLLLFCIYIWFNNQNQE